MWLSKRKDDEQKEFCYKIEMKFRTTAEINEESLEELAQEVLRSSTSFMQAKRYKNFTLHGNITATAYLRRSSK